MTKSYGFFFWNGIPYHYSRPFKEFYDCAAGNCDFQAEKGHVVLREAALSFSYLAGCSLLLPHSLPPPTPNSLTLSPAWLAL